MTFRVTSRLRPSGGIPRIQNLDAAPKSLSELQDREPICRACEWFSAAVERCCHPYVTCTSSPHRIRPWERLRSCPEWSKV